ncbi:MAG: TetR family transcriptional regulator [Dermatophilaceae bacterium]
MTTPARAPLTREALFARALAIVDAEGLPALTMRRLAADLGVEAASLYHHVAGKAELLDGALALMRTEIVLEQPLPQGWPDLLEAVFLRYLEVLMDHPHLLPLAGRHVDSDPAQGLPYLVEQGLSVRDAVDLFQGLLALSVGYAVFATRQFERDAAYLPPTLAEAMGTWSKDTARRNLRALIRSYVPGPGSASPT